MTKLANIDVLTLISFTYFLYMSLTSSITKTAEPKLDTRNTESFWLILCYIIMPLLMERQQIVSTGGAIWGPLPQASVERFLYFILKYILLLLNQINRVGHYNCQVCSYIHPSSKLKNQLQYDILYICGISRTKLSQ